MSIGVKPCLGCASLGRWDRSGRCDGCQLAAKRTRERNPRRRAIKRARYDSTHRKLREWWRLQVMSGCVRCARCDRWIDAGAAWDLDHLDNGTERPSHASCNRAATRKTQPTKEITR